MKVEIDQITDAQIRRLRTRAAEAGDEELADLCTRALWETPRRAMNLTPTGARIRCAEAISEAKNEEILRALAELRSSCGDVGCKADHSRRVRTRSGVIAYRPGSCPDCGEQRDYRCCHCSCCEDCDCGCTPTLAEVRS